MCVCVTVKREFSFGQHYSFGMGPLAGSPLAAGTWRGWRSRASTARTRSPSARPPSAGSASGGERQGNRGSSGLGCWGVAKATREGLMGGSTTPLTTHHTPGVWDLAQQAGNVLSTLGCTRNMWYGQQAPGNICTNSHEALLFGVCATCRMPIPQIRQSTEDR